MNSDMLPSVSVIIPVYNHGRYLADAINSVLAQDYQDWEIVIVDDGSTDDTPIIVSRYANDQVRYVFQENKGQAAARNTGIKNSHGRYLAFLDADDWFLPDKLQLQVPVLEAHPDLCMVSSGWLFVDEQGNTLEEVRPWESCPSLDVEAWLLGCPFVVHGVLVRREAIDQAGLFDESQSLVGVEDWDLFLRIAATGQPMEWVRQITCKYRMHQENMTRSTWRQKEKTRVLDKFFATPIATAMSEVLKRRAYANVLLEIANCQYMAGAFDDAKESVSRAVDWLPTIIEGDPPSLVTTFRNWALEPRVSQRVQHISSVFDHLPDSVSRLRNYRKQVLAAVHMNLAFSNYACHNSRGVLSEIVSGLVCDPTWMRNRGVWAIAAKSCLDLLGLA